MPQKRREEAPLLSLVHAVCSLDSHRERHRERESACAQSRAPNLDTHTLRVGSRRTRLPAHAPPQVFDLNEVEERGLRSGSGGHDGGGRSGSREERHQDLEQEAATSPALGSMKLSSDQRMLACTIDLDGSDRFVLAVFDLLGGGAGETARARGGGTPQQGGPPRATVLREDAM